MRLMLGKISSKDWGLVQIYFTTAGPEWYKLLGETELVDRDGMVYYFYDCRYCGATVREDNVIIHSRYHNEQKRSYLVAAGVPQEQIDLVFGKVTE
jgi:hypothetical protein